MPSGAAGRCALVLMVGVCAWAAGVAGASAAECKVEAVRAAQGPVRERFLSWLRIYSRTKDPLPWEPEKFAGYRVYVADIDNDGVEEYILTDEDVPDSNPQAFIENIGLWVFRPAAAGWSEIEAPFDPLTEIYTDPVAGQPSPLLVRFCGTTYVNTEGGRPQSSFRETLVWRGGEVSPACDAGWLAEQRRMFQTLFDHKLYREAHAFLAGVARSCDRGADAQSWLWMQSDLALSAYRMGRMNSCLEHVAAARRRPGFARAGEAVRRAIATHAALCAAARHRPAASYDFSWLRELLRDPNRQVVLDPRFDGLLAAVAPDAKLAAGGEALPDVLRLALWVPDEPRLVGGSYLILSGWEPHNPGNMGGLWVDLVARRSIVWLLNAGEEGARTLLASTTIDAAHVPREFWEQGPFAPFQQGEEVGYLGPDGPWRRIPIP